MFEKFTKEARAAVVLAQQEARDADVGEIRPEHLLVGVVQSAGRDLAAVLSEAGLTADALRVRLSSAGDDDVDEDAAALRAIGIDLDAVRDAVERGFGPDAFDDAVRSSGRRQRRRGHLPFTRPAKKVLELALREALAHKSREIRVEHVLLAILRGDDTATVELVTDFVDAAHLRVAVAALLDEAA